MGKTKLAWRLASDKHISDSKVLQGGTPKRKTSRKILMEDVYTLSRFSTSENG